jgi:hypothetical protein
MASSAFRGSSAGTTLLAGGNAFWSSPVHAPPFWSLNPLRMYVTVFCGIDDTKIFKDLHLNYVLGTQALGADHYDREVIRGGLTRNLGRCFPQVRDEMVHAFDYVLALPENGLSYHSGLPYGSFPPQNGNLSRSYPPHCKSSLVPATVCLSASRSVSASPWQQSRYV